MIKKKLPALLILISSLGQILASFPLNCYNRHFSVVPFPASLTYILHTDLSKTQIMSLQHLQDKADSLCMEHMGPPPVQPHLTSLPCPSHYVPACSCSELVCGPVKRISKHRYYFCAILLTCFLPYITR